jgi:ornithine carbamoyltransferase
VQPLRGRCLTLLLEKPSTRTRLSFEVGVQEMGGHLIVANAQELQLGRGEPVADTSRMLSLYTHGVIYRTTSMQAARERRARANLSAELAELQRSEPQ